MTLETYKILHVVGLMLLFSALGAVLLAAAPDGRKPPKAAAMLHGVALIVMLVAGFGLLARLGIHWPWPLWTFLKIGAWLLLGAMPTLVRKGIVPVPIGWLVAVGIGAAAAWLGVTKPFVE